MPILSVGPVSLIVPSLEKSVAFYANVLGFSTLGRANATASLGTSDGNVLLELIENPVAVRPGRRSPGLFHFAVLFPTRASLGQELIHLLESGWNLSGAGDHLVSEALYLNDIDGNGIELYADRPRETWTFKNGQVQMDTLTVDIDSLLAEAKRDSSPWTGLPIGTTMGHVHLKVSDVDAAGRFYRDIIGLDLMATMPQSQFLAADGYHHHLGLNTWMSGGSPAAPEGSLGLNAFTINIPDQLELEAIINRLRTNNIDFELKDSGATTQDPSKTKVRLRVSGSALPFGS